MYVELSNLFPEAGLTIVAVLISGLVIKTMDDVLDEDDDITPSKLLGLFGRSVLPYSLALFSLALALDFRTSFVLFWSSYTVGMFGFPSQILPSRISAWVEILIGALIMTFVVGLTTTIWGLLVIVSVQLIDDYLDRKHDQHIPSRNFALKYGTGECFLLSLVTLYTAVYLFPFESVLVYSTALLIGNIQTASTRGVESS